MDQPQHGKTIVAIATPPGRGAICLLRLAGPRALDILRRLSARRRFVPRRVYHLRLHTAAGEPIDDVLAVFMPGPNSYTGDDVVEISGHGGTINAQRLRECLIAAGAEAAAPGEFTRRAFENGKVDLSQAEAVCELIEARSEQAHRNARRLLDGQLGDRIAQLRQLAVGVAADLEANIDFAEDTEDAVSAEEIDRQLGELSEGLERLAQSYKAGRRLSGITVALVGAVNAGKSSIFNALLGEERALVSSERGTTRDYIEAEAMFEQTPVTLVDTAGERPAEQMDTLEQAGYHLGKRRVGSCDLIAQVVAADEVSAAAINAQTGLLIVNKVDLVEGSARQQLFARWSGLAGERALHFVSARDGEGMAQLPAKMLAALGAESDLEAEAFV